jgi:hypothetical protein
MIYLQEDVPVSILGWGRRKKHDGFVYRVPGPGGQGYRWIARSIHGHVAHGRTPESAVERLGVGMNALARAAGVSFEEWRRSQRTDSSRFLRAGELVQA